MPQPSLSAQERRLAAFCRFFAVVYFAGAAIFALAPQLTFRVATLGAAAAPAGPEARFWNVLAVAMMTAVGTACLVTAGSPRERRHAVLPVAVAKLTSSAAAAAHLIASGRAPALAAVVATDLPLFLLTLAVYRMAAPGVRSAAAREAVDAPAAPQAPRAEEPPRVQLTVSKR
ncbi:MAG TPA: hypothetical protein VI356_18830 [Myxococcales bacterium]